MKERTLTIEEMIEAGATWVEISARVKALQKEQIEKKRAEEAAKAEKAKKVEAALAAKKKLIVALRDWLVAEDILSPEDKETFCKDISGIIDSFSREMKEAQELERLFGGWRQRLR